MWKGVVNCMANLLKRLSPPASTGTPSVPPKLEALPEPAAGSADGEEPVTETAKVEDVGEGEREGP